MRLLADQLRINRIKSFLTESSSKV